MTTPLESFASFVPRMIVERFAQDSTPPSEATSRHFPAAVFLADVAGFTKMSERIGNEGPGGVEKLTNLLNDYFGRMIDLVDAHGGDVIKFAGDAVIAIWKAEAGSQGLQQATLRAAMCGMAIQETLHDYEADETRLSQRINISCGDVRSLELGGIFDRWEWLVEGQPVEQMADAKQIAAVGRVSLTADAWTLIRQDCTAEVFSDGQAMLQEIRRTLAPKRVENPPLRAAMDRGLRAFIPGAILSRMAAGHSDWLGELRQVSILFAHLPDLRHDTPLDLIQSAMRTMQAATYDCEGSVNKLSADDKGTTLVSAFGLPPLTHDDDPARAVRTALSMRAGLDQIGLQASIGVTTGCVFCGPVGNEIRREYTVMGDDVNLAARLMQAAKGGILCDQATFQRVGGRCEFEALPPMQVKGKEHALQVFRPLRVCSQHNTTASPLIGRDREVALVRETLAAFRNNPTNAVMTVCGTGDIGKSRMLEEIASIARAAGFQVFSGGGSSLEESSPYHAWRSVLGQIMELERFADQPQMQRQAVIDHLAGDESLLDRIPLLNSVLPWDFPESETVRQMQGKVRAANTQELLVRFIERTAAKRETLLLLDDAQWFDSGSWAVTGLVARRVDNLLLILATRPLGDPPPVEYQQLAARPDLLQLQLGPLTRQEINRLLCEDLDVREMPEAVSSFINDRVEGQPFFAQQLAYALRDTSLIRCAEGRCELTCDPGNLERLDFPNALTGVITSRLDRLVPQQQMTVKTASVIGRTFAIPLLQAIYPFEEDKHALRESLDGLERNQIVQPADTTVSRTYEFTYGMIQQVAYNLMLFGQRRQLHQAIASYFESLPGEAPPAMFPLLAHHWARAGVESKSLEYLERAADDALLIGAYKEAKFFLEQILSRRELVAVDLPDLQAAVLQRKLGQAHLGMGELQTGQAHFHRALELLGSAAPQSDLATVLSISFQALLQIGHRLRRRRSNRQKTDAALYEQVCNHEHLAEVHYFANNSLGFLHAVLRSLNLAEVLNAYPEMARTSANMGVTVGTMRMHSVAERYLGRAQKTASTVNHLPTQSWVYLVTGIYCNGVGRWMRSREALDRSMAITKRLGDDRQVAVLLTVRGATFYYQGDFDGALEHWLEVLALGQRRNDLLQEAWGHGGLAMIYLRLGQLSLAIENAETACELFRSNADTVSEIATGGVLAIACLRSGDAERAVEVAEQVLRQLGKLRRPNSYFLFEAYSAAAEVFLHQRQNVGRDVNQAVLRNSVLAQRMLLAYAKSFPLGRPRQLIWQGVEQGLRLRTRKAIKSWRKSIALSESLGMRYDLALGHLQLGRCTVVSKQQRVTHIEKAIDLFTQCNAQYDREVAESTRDNLAAGD